MGIGGVGNRVREPSQFSQAPVLFMATHQRMIARSTFDAKEFPPKEPQAT
jgi:hypothetical protein